MLNVRLAGDLAVAGDVFDGRVERKTLRNRLNYVQDTIQDTSWEKGQHKKTPW